MSRWQLEMAAMVLAFVLGFVFMDIVMKIVG